ncbi:uncharacterized protein [Medicago truncatula]|uniref:uncharacterized protein n=1 Tax=Medicago truncatula TaxID=3880 RepID=UPI001967A224|nr:uncharacterized protein LOC120577885 [Medicago truncatula]
MAKRRKLSIGHRENSNEGRQSIPTNSNSTNVQGSNGAETGSSPSHTESVMPESVESHSIPSNIEAEEEERIVEGPKRRRGPTRMLDIWEMEDDFIIVKLDNFGRPIGDEGTAFTRYLGSIVRRSQYAPINIKTWKDMPSDNKKAMLKQIEKRFEFVPPITDELREMIKSDLNEKWRQWKGDLKATGFDPSKTVDEIVSGIELRDARIDEVQYPGLVEYWFSDEAKKASTINKQNRAKYQDVHCMGTKSLPKFIDEKMKKGKGVMPGRQDIYIETRTRKDGSIVNEKAARMIEELKKIVMKMEHLNQLKTIRVLCLGRMTYFLKYKELQRRGACDVWESYLNLKNQRLICLKMKSCVIELRLWRAC